MDTILTEVLLAGLIFACGIIGKSHLAQHLEIVKQLKTITFTQKRILKHLNLDEEQEEQ